MRLCKAINLFPSIVCSGTTGAIATFYVLYSVGTGTETLLVANRASNIPGAVCLHVHVQFVLIVEVPVARSTLKCVVTSTVVVVVAVNTIAATGVSVAFQPLGATKAAATQVFLAARAFAAHLWSCGVPKDEKSLPNILSVRESNRMSVRENTEARESMLHDANKGFLRHDDDGCGRTGVCFDVKTS